MVPLVKALIAKTEWHRSKFAKKYRKTLRDLGKGEFRLNVTDSDAPMFAQRSEARSWCAELYRLRGVFLEAVGADETQIEASFRAAINTAKQQKSISLAMRAEASYAEYRDQKGER
jgi:hypothetical protein